MARTTLREQVDVTARSNPGKNLDDILRLIGRGLKTRYVDRQRLGPELEQGDGEGLADLTKFNSTPPILFATRYTHLSRRRPQGWEEPLIAAGFVADDCVQEPVRDNSDFDSIDNPDIRDRLRLLDTLRIPDQHKAIAWALATDLIAQWQSGRVLTEALLGRMLTQIYVFGSFGAQLEMSEVANASLRNTVETKDQMIGLLTHQPQQPPGQQQPRSRRPNGTNE